MAEEQHDVAERVVAVGVASKVAVDKLAGTGYKAQLVIVAPDTAYSDIAMEPPVESDTVGQQVADTESKMQWTQGKHAVADLADIDSHVTVGDRVTAAIALGYASIELWEEAQASVASDHDLGAELSFLGGWM